jgi:alkylhydroperoxidase family enzyme
VRAVLCDPETAPISAEEKVLLRFVARVNRGQSQVTRADVEAARCAGWSEEALYDAIAVCALFNFYNRWIDGNGVQHMPPHGYQASGRRIATEGYLKDAGK